MCAHMKYFIPLRDYLLREQINWLLYRWRGLYTSDLPLLQSSPSFIPCRRIKNVYKECVCVCVLRVYICIDRIRSFVYLIVCLYVCVRVWVVCHVRTVSSFNLQQPSLITCLLSLFSHFFFPSMSLTEVETIRNRVIFNSYRVFIEGLPPR